jgi:hypothetical protein
MTTTDLTAEQRTAARNVFRNTPVSALFKAYGPEVRTVEDVINHAESIVEFLKLTMEKQDAAEVELRNLTDDLQAVGRVLKLTGAGQ